MPIADCGFPSALPIPNTDPQQFLSGRDALIRVGPTTAVEIGFIPDLFHADPNVVRQALDSARRQPLSQQLVPALIDTGATESCIDEELAHQLQLPLVDRQQGSGVGGTDKFRPVTNLTGRCPAEPCSRA